ncbi:MAG: replication terminator protein [Clostridia bacterium]|jgi:hypothetical protein|nr:replication terminator protein [Clostridia bacterium]
MELNFNELAGGAAIEKINTELQKVFENIKDPNTSETAKRKLNIVMTFTPDKHDNDVVIADIDVTTRLAPVMGVGTRFIVDVDSKGQIVAAEWGKQMKGQLSVDDVIEDEEPDSKEKPDSSSNVIDYQKIANK